MSETVLSAHALDVVRGGRPLVTRLDLVVRSGEALAISGPSGCGKSSLLRVLAGLDAPAAGDVRLRGRRPEEIGWTLYRRAVQHVPAVPALHGATVADALARAFSFAVASSRSDDPAIAPLLARAGLPAEILAQRPDTLSTGQQLRVGLVRAALVRPEILLLDEPTAALDDETRDAVEALLRDELARGAGIVIVTHDAAQSQRLGATRLRLSALEPARG